MNNREVFLSVVVALRDAETWIEDRLRNLATILAAEFDYYEIVVVDNGSKDNTARVVSELQKTLQNIQFYVLARAGPASVALTAGLDHSIGDFTAIMDLFGDPPEQLPGMVSRARAGVEIVYALPTERVHNKGLYNRLVGYFLRVIARINEVDLPRSMSSYRLLSRTVVNYIQESADRHRTLAIAPALSGYSYDTIEYTRRGEGKQSAHHVGFSALSRAIELMFSSSVRPLRIITIFALGISAISVLYAVYVLIVAFSMDSVASGWPSLSLQVSGLFFLVSLVLAAMSEYLLQVLETSNRRPIYHVARQSHSSVMDFRRELNVVRPQEFEEQRGRR